MKNLNNYLASGILAASLLYGGCASSKIGQKNENLSRLEEMTLREGDKESLNCYILETKEMADMTLYSNPDYIYLIHARKGNIRDMLHFKIEKPEWYRKKEQEVRMNLLPPYEGVKNSLSLPGRKVNSEIDSIDTKSFSSISEIFEFLKNYSGKKIDRLEIISHGSPTSLCQNNSGDEMDILDIDKSYSRKDFCNAMSSEGYIVLIACSTNKDSGKQVTLAEYLSYLFNVPVIAPSRKSHLQNIVPLLVKEVDEENAKLIYNPDSLGLDEHSCEIAFGDYALVYPQDEENMEDKLRDLRLKESVKEMQNHFSQIMK